MANTCLDTQGGYLRGEYPPQKLENFVFLKLKSCNLVNTFGTNLEQAMSKKVMDLTDLNFAFWEKFCFKKFAKIIKNHPFSFF